MGFNDKTYKTKDLDAMTQEEFDTYVEPTGPALPEEREKLLKGTGPAADPALKKGTGPAAE